MTRIAIAQSNYIPWRGYFSLISTADIFVVLDSVQYTKNDWRNRNQLCGPNGLFWLTIPIVRGSTRGSIHEARVNDSRWSTEHLTSIRQALSGMQFAETMFNSIEPVYRSLASETRLHPINMALIRNICTLSSITTELLLDSDLRLSHPSLDQIDPTVRLIEICKELGANSYITGPRGLDYLNLDYFRKANIRVEVANYARLPQYRQKFPGYVPSVSVLDFISAVGPEDAAAFFRSIDIAG